MKTTVSGLAILTSLLFIPGVAFSQTESLALIPQTSQSKNIDYQEIQEAVFVLEELEKQGIDYRDLPAILESFDVPNSEFQDENFHQAYYPVIVLGTMFGFLTLLELYHWLKGEEENLEEEERRRREIRNQRDLKPWRFVK